MASAFILETLHLQSTNASYTDCNTKACYNHVVTIITALAKYKAGLPISACILLAKALKQMTYSIVTAYKPFKTNNKHSTDNPLHDINQGPMDVPPRWTFNSDICKKCYDKHAHCFLISDPTKEIVIQQNAVQFVDDTKLSHNKGMMTITPQQLMQITGEDITMWDKFLNIDGGLLELLKIVYTILTWKFSAAGMPTIIPKHELPVNTVQVIRRGIPTAIKLVDETTAHKLLGAYSARNQSND
eukprot:550904-Ditylum_brightwellii.AAC.1